MTRLKVNDISMYYEIHGQGEPIIFVGGFSTDHTMWSEVIDRFKDQYQVILLDNRGCGQTDVPSASFNIEQMAQDVVDLCSKLNIKQAHFVGNSMGGFIVQTLAYHHSNLIKSCVISNSGATIHPPFQLYLEAQLEFIKANAPLNTLVKAACSWIYSHHFFSQPGAIEKLIKQEQGNPHPFTVRGYQGQYAALSSFNSTNWIKKIKVPTLVVSGAQDLVFDAASVKALADEISHSEYYCFSDCGHLPPIEYPEEFTRVVKEFFQSNHSRNIEIG